MAFVRLFFWGFPDFLSLSGRNSVAPLQNI